MSNSILVIAGTEFKSPFDFLCLSFEDGRFMKVQATKKGCPLSIYEVYVYSYLRHARRYGKSKSIPQIAAFLHLCRHAVGKHIKALAELNLVKKEGTKWRANLPDDDTAKWFAGGADEKKGYYWAPLPKAKTPVSWLDMLIYGISLSRSGKASIGGLARMLRVDRSTIKRAFRRLRKYGFLDKVGFIKPSQKTQRLISKVRKPLELNPYVIFEKYQLRTDDLGTVWQVAIKSAQSAFSDLKIPEAERAKVYFRVLHYAKAKGSEAGYKKLLALPQICRDACRVHRQNGNRGYPIGLIFDMAKLPKTSRARKKLAKVAKPLPLAVAGEPLAINWKSGAIAPPLKEKVVQLPRGCGAIAPGGVVQLPPLE